MLWLRRYLIDLGWALWYDGLQPSGLKIHYGTPWVTKRAKSTVTFEHSERTLSPLPNWANDSAITRQLDCDNEFEEREGKQQHRPVMSCLKYLLVKEALNPLSSTTIILEPNLECARRWLKTTRVAKNCLKECKQCTDLHVFLLQTFTQCVVSIVVDLGVRGGGFNDTCLNDTNKH